MCAGSISSSRSTTNIQEFAQVLTGYYRYRHMGTFSQTAVSRFPYFLESTKFVVRIISSPTLFTSLVVWMHGQHEQLSERLFLGERWSPNPWEAEKHEEHACGWWSTSTVLRSHNAITFDRRQNGKVRAHQHSTKVGSIEQTSSYRYHVPSGATDLLRPPHIYSPFSGWKEKMELIWDSMLHNGTI